MIRLFKNYFQVFKFRIFNNKLSIFCNFLHEINYFLAKLVFLFKLRNNDKIKELSNELKEQGYIIFDNDRCKNDLNLVPFLIEVAEEGGTVGEIVEVMKKVYGEWEESFGI